MRSFSLTFLAGSVLALNLMAEPNGPNAFQQTTTTGIIGLVSGQTARLSVLNLNPVVTSTNGNAAPANCNVELQFFGPGGSAVGPNKIVTNFAPQSAVFLDGDRNSLNPPGVAATLRGEIRGVVTVNPTPTPVGSPAAVGNCAVMVTLEIIDNTTQSTVALTTATHTSGPVTLGPSFMRD
jgi:hypothetical protein